MTSPFKRSIPLALSLITVLCAPVGAQDFEGEEPVPAEVVAKRLPTPPVTATPRKVTTPPAKTRLLLVSKTANVITDDDAWFARIRLRLPDYAFMGANQPYAGDQLPDGSPMQYAAQPLQRALPGQPGRVLLTYGMGYTDYRYLVCAKTPYADSSEPCVVVGDNVSRFANEKKACFRRRGWGGAC